MPPAAPPVERVRSAYASRSESDYIANFWTALGWSILTCGIYGLYVIYQLTRRSRDHNRRRLDLLEASTALAWERAQSSGKADQLRPQFERIGGHMNVLRGMLSDFRDPVIWTLICLLTGIGYLILYILLDQDLVKHDQAERAIEADLVAVYNELGADLPAPVGEAHVNHNYAARVVVLLVTFGIYGLWWQYNIMDDGNRHFETNWTWEDGLRHALGG